MSRIIRSVTRGKNALIESIEMSLLVYSMRNYTISFSGKAHMSATTFSSNSFDCMSRNK